MLTNYKMKLATALSCLNRSFQATREPLFIITFLCRYLGHTFQSAYFEEFLQVLPIELKKKQ